ncbi:hypothetical protein LTR37_010058 [Vermiconidia calcicola]|uniref:Uncharacterized protein n=1 Tax=Vermiconidia calcicola TaxID=1690605 RepID=A0ACC3N7R5_9PEZI|nr:hypothetical protein LTR37_010058 [Vermiconidia calcicola]
MTEREKAAEEDQHRLRKRAKRLLKREASIAKHERNESDQQHYRESNAVMDRHPRGSADTQDNHPVPEYLPPDYESVAPAS